jgi:glycosyltransferase involved in cell wall biosynthesis
MCAAGALADAELVMPASDAVDPLHIMHVLAPAAFGGLESVVRMLAHGQHARGHRVTVATVLETSDDARALRAALSGDGAEVVPIVLPGRSYLREWRAIAALCRQMSPSIVHTHGYRADIVAGWAARHSGVPTVSTVHGFTGGSWKNRLNERLDCAALARFHAVVAVSRPLAARLGSERVPPQRVHILPNAFESLHRDMTRADARATLGVSADDWRIGWVGRMTHEKGPDVMLRAMTDVPDATLSFVGSAPSVPALQAEALALGVAPRVTWHGMIPDAGRVLAAFDVLVISSRTEGTPIVLLEAMAAGVPIVATSVGGIPDVVSESEAVLVASEDSGAIARAIADVRANPDAARQRALSARARLSNERGLARWLDHHETIYRAASLAAGAVA